MNKKLFTLIFTLLVLLLSLHSQAATIKIDIDRKIGDIDPKIYGVFMEPIHFDAAQFGGELLFPDNTLYGTLYDPGSPLANEDGFKKNFIEAGRELKITNMRWPGGNYVAGYNWQDGIGPKDKRPVRKELAWGALDTNQVGTDEWVKLNKALGTENVVCINLGTGTLNDARYWVEYCNSEVGSYYADLRAKYGNKKPYNIKYWCLGNEVDGSPWIMGYKNAEDYCKIAKEAAKVMRYTDKNIKFIANGSSYYEPSGKWMDWNLKVLTELRDVADFISIHRYWEQDKDYYVYMGKWSNDIEEKINRTASQIKAVRTRYKMEKPIYISFDEWAPHGRGLLPTLAAAQYFNSFIRHADVVKMANYTMFTTLLGYDPKKGSFKTHLFHTFKLLSNNCLGESVDVFVDSETFDVDELNKDIPYLDATAVYSNDQKTLFINVVNRHKEKTISANIINSSGTFQGKAHISEINRKDIYAGYKFDDQEQYFPAISEKRVKGNKMTLSFPAHSFTQVEVKISK
jgi:alpha-N-arabinofuranosidase